MLQVGSGFALSQALCVNQQSAFTLHIISATLHTHVILMDSEQK